MDNINFAFKIINNNITKTDLFRLLNSCVKDSVIGTYKFIFYIRSIKRGHINYGMGNRKLFYWCLEWWLNYDYESLILNLPIIPEYGSWKDLLFFFNTPLEKNMISVFTKRLLIDLNLKYGIKPSLAAKYAPSEHSSYDKKYNAAAKFSTELNMSLRTYRKTLTILRKELDIIETKLCNRDYNNINYSNIPKYAMKKYGKIPHGILYNEDYDRYMNYYNHSLFSIEDKIYNTITQPLKSNNIKNIMNSMYNVKYTKYENIDNLHLNDHTLSDNIIDLNVNYPNYLNIINDTEKFNLSNIEINDEPVIDPSKRQKKQLIKEITEPIQSDIDDFVLV